MVALVIPITSAFGAGPVATVTVAVAPQCIRNNGTSTSTGTATVKDSTGAGVSGQTVVFATDGHVTFGPVLDHLDGTYTSTITSSTTVGVEHISATAGGKTSSNTAALTVSGLAATVSLAPLSPSTIRANGTSMSTATATVKDASGLCVGGDTVTFASSPSAPTGPTPGPTTDHGDGTYSATLVSSTTPGQYSITATDASASKTSTAQTLTEFGPANTVILAPKTVTLTADGASKAGLTATVTDVNGVGVNDDTVLFTTSGDATFDPVVNNHDGTYNTSVIASKTADVETLTAHAETKMDTATLTENAGPASTVALTVTPNSIPADNGTSPAAAKATVKDANGNLVKNETVTFSTSGDVTFNPVTTPSGGNGDGTYSSTISSSKTADNETIKATTSNGKFGTASLTETPGNASGIALKLNPTTIAADGTSTSTATATVTDSNGNGVPNVTVGFGTNGDTTISPPSATTDSSGKASTTITASKTADTETITANGAGKTTSQPLVEYGPAKTVSVTLSKNPITADGKDTSVAKATLADANGKPVLNETVVFTTSGDVTFGPVTNNGDGTYTATITASKTADTETITGKATNANVSGTAQPQLTEMAGPPVMGLTLSPSSMPADGKSATTATASVKDQFGNPYPSETVTIATNGDTTVGTVTNHNDGTYTATITASKTADNETIAAGDAAKSLTKTATLTETPSGTGFHSLPPTRILDTRTQGGGGPLQPNSQRKVQITGNGNVPATHVSGAVLNLTGTQASTQTFLTVFPSGSPPNASNLNLAPGRDAANLVTAQVAADGSVQLYNAQGTVHAIFDVVGYYDDGSVATPPHYTALTPARILDTRSGSPIGPNSQRKVQITGNGGVPATHVSAVVLNLTGTQASQATFLTVFPSGNVPTASNLNLRAGEDRPNLVMVPVAADGSVQLYNAQGTVHAIFDVTGYFDDGTLATAKGFTALPPSRILDTRSGGALGPGGQRGVQVAGNGGVPATGATAVVINITATRASNGTFLTVFPAAPRPVASNLNVPPGTDIPNLAVATLAPDGSVQLYNDQGTVDVIFDVVGWFGS
jgi:adhesin/invasin